MAIVWVRRCARTVSERRRLHRRDQRRPIWPACVVGPKKVIAAGCHRAYGARWPHERHHFPRLRAAGAGATYPLTRGG
jgi:hypothetical protein